MMRRARRAFTLLEAIVGVAIAAALLVALGVFVRNLGDARARLATAAERVECADAVFALVERALATAVVADPALGAGVGGNESTLRIVRATVGLGEGDAPLLAERERCEVRHDPSSARIEVARGERRDALSVPVRAMRIRYLGEGGWADAFDSADAGVFPVGVEVSIWFANDGGDAADEAVAIGPPDRRRFFRVPGAPRIDPLARRAILDADAAQDPRDFPGGRDEAAADAPTSGGLRPTPRGGAR